MSVAGGLPRAVERAVVHRCDAFQIFAKNASQWRRPPLPPNEIREFRAAIRRTGIGPVVSHASYLINLATTIPGLRGRSMEAMGDELDRAEALGLLGVVLHPGCYTVGSEAEGLELIAAGLPRSRPFPPHRQRPPLWRAADAAGNTERGAPLTTLDRSRSLR